jgi:hypothetical protein
LGHGYFHEMRSGAREREVGCPMASSYNDNLLKALGLTREMLALADEGDLAREDDSCGILYSVIRDSAYRIRELAEQECERHKAAGKWDRE